MNKLEGSINANVSSDFFFLKENQNIYDLLSVLIRYESLTKNRFDVNDKED
jgi:hypothetical protein